MLAPVVLMALALAGSFGPRALAMSCPDTVIPLEPVAENELPDLAVASELRDFFLRWAGQLRLASTGGGPRDSVSGRIFLRDWAPHFLRSGQELIAVRYLTILGALGHYTPLGLSHTGPAPVHGSSAVYSIMGWQGRARI